MQINRIDNTNFKAIYRIKSTPTIINEIYEKIIPGYRLISNESAFAVIGNNPFKKILDLTMKEIADKNNSSVQWVKMNAENHGINLNNALEDVVYLFTGNNEICDLSKYLIERNSSLKKTLKERIKNFFFPPKPSTSYPQNIPEYLDKLVQVLEYDNQETTAFKNYVEKRVKNVNSIQDLFMAMMSER